MLDRLDPQLRHLVLMLLVPVLAFVGAEVVPALGLHPLVAGLVGVVLAQLIAYFTPITRQYGVGDRGEPASGAPQDRSTATPGRAPAAGTASAAATPAAPPGRSARPGRR